MRPVGVQRERERGPHGRGLELHERRVIDAPRRRQRGPAAERSARSAPSSSPDSGSARSSGIRDGRERRAGPSCRAAPSWSPHHAAVDVPGSRRSRRRRSRSRRASRFAKRNAVGRAHRREIVEDVGRRLVVVREPADSNMALLRPVTASDGIHDNGGDGLLDPHDRLLLRVARLAVPTLRLARRRGT